MEGYQVGLALSLHSISLDTRSNKDIRSDKECHGFYDLIF